MIFFSYVVLPHDLFRPCVLQGVIYMLPVLIGLVAIGGITLAVDSAAGALFGSESAIVSIGSLCLMIFLYWAMWGIIFDSSTLSENGATLVQLQVPLFAIAMAGMSSFFLRYKIYAAAVFIHVAMLIIATVSIATISMTFDSAPREMVASMGMTPGSVERARFVSECACSDYDLMTRRFLDLTFSPVAIIGAAIGYLVILGFGLLIKRPHKT